MRPVRETAAFTFTQLAVLALTAAKRNTPSRQGSTITEIPAHRSYSLPAGLLSPLPM